MSSQSERISLEQRPEPRLEEHISVYCKDMLGAHFQELIAARLAAAVRGMDTRVERIVVRFEDLNGPKGGTDTACRIQVSLSGRPAIVVEARADGEGRAFRLALPRLASALGRERQRSRSRTRSTLRLALAE